MKNRFSVKYLVFTAVLLAVSGSALFAAGHESSEDFEFPTSDKGANFYFTSFPDLFNWNIDYPQPGWEDAMDWYLGGMKKEGPAFSLNAGDIMDARWWETPEQVRRKTKQYWGGFAKRFRDKDIRLFIAPGDHEYGDDGGLNRHKNLVPVYAEQFVKIFRMPLNGPEHKKGLAYSFTKGNLAVISLDQFEDKGEKMEMSVSGKQLEWFENELKNCSDKDFIIVQGHMPAAGPVRSKNSSANMLKGGTNSEFWKTMTKYGVDAYLCGEHHRITAKRVDGIWQIVHGALWGTQTDVNYLRGSVFDDKLVLELFKFDVKYSGGHIGDHPHRKPTHAPREKVDISQEAKKHGPNLVGRLIIEKSDKGNITTLTSGAFLPDWYKQF
ncbi:hypothetical protein L21SP3_01556 [Sedimentisphaera cyanobacteriorum]|uniref:Uncharacterized protein n=1 Tax=Sedimentisphaera cyanobacteriorum TaxID=1940790 RepID=A0A1Q2HR49_9BACT|nr:metallophosphoesterase [Sedimentisphaera cyanobacteriorum]AQQ09744.1 hypothetical protein L21SP3_01556 [Sedimentisphaera cyanobacteriorum]